jgi:hypothetical protein
MVNDVVILSRNQTTVTERVPGVALTSCILLVVHFMNFDGQLHRSPVGQANSWRPPTTSKSARVQAQAETRSISSSICGGLIRDAPTQVEQPSQSPTRSIHNQPDSMPSYQSSGAADLNLLELLASANLEYANLGPHVLSTFIRDP